MFKEVLVANDNVKLRRIEPIDAEDLFELTIKNRLYLRKYLPWLDYINEVDDSADFIRSTQMPDSGLSFGVWYDNELVGMIGFHPFNKKDNAAAIGYWISEHVAGLGIAKVATAELIRYGLKELNIHRIEIRCASKNIGSQKVAQGCGLKFEGIMRDAEFLYDHFVDLHVYAILTTD